VSLIFSCAKCGSFQVSVIARASFSLNEMRDGAEEEGFDWVDLGGSQSYHCNDCDYDGKPLEEAAAEDEFLTILDLKPVYEAAELNDMEMQGITDSDDLVTVQVRDKDGTLDDGIARRDPETGDVWALCWVRLHRGER